MSAFHDFDKNLSQLLPEMENFANKIEHQTVIERPTVCYPPQYGYQNYYSYGYNNNQQPQPSDSYYTYQNYTYQYNQYSQQPYPYFYYPPPPVQQPAPITIVIPKCDDQQVIKLEINMGVGGQTSQINIIQSNVEEKEAESVSLQAITELLEPSDYSTVYDNEQNTVYAEMNNVNSQELFAIEGNPILNALETPKYFKEAGNKSSTAKKRLPIKKRKYTCSICNHYFYSKSSLTLHLIAHKKPFCSSCQKTFDDEESIDYNCCSAHKRYIKTPKTKKYTSKKDLKFILKTTTASVTENGEVQNWELIPKSVETKTIDDVKEKENIIDVNQIATKKKKVKKPIIEPEKVEPVVTKSRFGRTRTLKKFP